MVSNVLDKFTEIEGSLETKKEVDKCSSYILSKKYFALDELEDDNSKTIYVDKKYPSLDSDYVVLRLAEMYLTRAESNIMKNGSVSASDVADVNMIKNRASVALISGTPSQADMLDIIYNERSIELCFEWGDRFYNTRRLEKDIVG